MRVYENTFDCQKKIYKNTADFFVETINNYTTRVSRKGISSRFLLSLSVLSPFASI